MSLPPAPEEVVWSLMRGKASSTGGRLGCAPHYAYIEAKCDRGMVCRLLDATRIFYTRKLDDISEAQVEIGINGTSDDACCTCLGQIEPWCHVLVIVREGDGVVWKGPVQEVIYEFETVTIKALDKLAWLTVRINELPYAETDPTVSLTTTALAIAEIAMADDSDTPCFMDNIADLGDGLGASHDLRIREFPAFADSAYEDFQAIFESYLDFTVVKDTLIVGSDQLTATPITTLNDEHILGDVKIIKDGTLQGNRFFARYQQDDDPEVCGAQQGVPPEQAVTPCPAEASTPDDQLECYGRIERMLADGFGVLTLEPAEQVAQAYVDAGHQTPRLIEFPPGTQLSPDTPWKLNEMIPGQRVDVTLTRYCVDVFQSFRLLEVQVDENATGAEIGITLGSLNLLNEAS